MWFTPDHKWRSIQKDACYVANWRSGLSTGDLLFKFEPCADDVTSIQVTHKQTGETTIISALGLVRELYKQVPGNASVILQARPFNPGENGEEFK